MIAASSPRSLPLLSRTRMASRLARDIEEGWSVNLGIGIPTIVADQVALDKDVLFQSENGVLGVGPRPGEAEIDPWLINAGKQYVSLRPGGSYAHQADSFSLIRGGHLDLCVLGAFEVGANGDIANWATTLDRSAAPAVGGAMDLATGAKRVWVLMEHTTRDGSPRLLERCRLPLTAPGVVSRVYTNCAVIEVKDGRFTLLDLAEGWSLHDVQALTAARLWPATRAEPPPRA